MLIRSWRSWNSPIVCRRMNKAYREHSLILKPTRDNDFHIDVMAGHLLFYIFLRYQEEGKTPESISYSV